MKTKLLALALGLGGALAHADTTNWRFYGMAGTGFGGESILKGGYTDGSTWNVKTGLGLLYKVGMDYRVAPKFTVQGTLGRQRTATNASDAELALTTNSAELMGFYDMAPSWRLGAGVRVLTLAEVTGTGLATGLPVVGRYESEPGAVLELQYVLDSTPPKKGNDPGQFGISLRYVSETLKPVAGGASKNGDHSELGLFLYY
ncbi:hypothetical protein [Rhodoferax aquaticus]|uniref:Outer membrane protein beta-barrel domain-containing protein n=1 Tax=Rhodoferax aquaticus TaxID=2527691 RepID=A0A515EV36_9BURK|nr:hypothetical protein [Rhodoferax aquaticus]QDL56469.1 hypothetical protein EXZ61_21195 [Rhodoferax aquaticus]